ncbi:hypothetical protein ACFY4K_20650 [Streptomyces leeuwenhoekii]|uniref:hypothetical protein n=1 Tax=Streptomyces leeuwenhoekii TaxID=1437453 RepID=UPI0036A2543E
MRAVRSAGEVDLLALRGPRGLFAEVSRAGVTQWFRGCREWPKSTPEACGLAIELLDEQAEFLCSGTQLVLGWPERNALACACWVEIRARYFVGTLEIFLVSFAGAEPTTR